ncbi:MAG: hypothetical protein ACO35Q_01885, partial [Prochlorothrix sp.]
MSSSSVLVSVARPSSSLVLDSATSVLFLTWAESKSIDAAELIMLQAWYWRSLARSAPPVTQVAIPTITANFPAASSSLSSPISASDSATSS